MSNLISVNEDKLSQCRTKSFTDTLLGLEQCSMFFSRFPIVGQLEATNSLGDN